MLRKKCPTVSPTTVQVINDILDDLIFSLINRVFGGQVVCVF